MNAPPSSGTSKVFLAVALVLGLIATILAFAFISQANTGQSAPKQTILVASADLPVNAALDPDRDLVPLSVPRLPAFNKMAQLTLDPAAKASYKGQRINRSIPAGQPVFIADLGNVVEYHPSEGMVAVPITADVGIAVPGDFVKVLIARPEIGAADAPRANVGAAYAARGQRFRVVAIGNSLSKTRAQVLVSDASSGSAKSVTLEATEAQAQELLGALGGGAFRATLAIVSSPAESPGAAPAAPPASPAAPPAASRGAASAPARTRP